MKIRQQSTLVFRRGSVEKLYTLDLVEVAPGRCLVTFRYGRRNGPFREGTKTVAPVPYAEARRIFAKLLREKLDRGYEGAAQPLSSDLGPLLFPVQVETPPLPVLGLADDTPPPPPAWRVRERALLVALAVGDRRLRKRGARRGLSLTRVIWRCGELRMRAAEPLLLGLLPSAPPMRAYCIVWALGRCGSERSIETLARIYQSPQTPRPLHAIATEALLAVSDEVTRAEFRAEQLELLPPLLREAARQGDTEAVSDALHALLRARDATRFDVLRLLYLIDSPVVRPALLAAVRGAPLASAAPVLRDLFKIAEFRRDGEVYGLIAYRFATTSASSAERRVPYDDRARAYLRRRVWRTLRRLGDLEDPDYLPMALGVVLPFRERDARPLRPGARAHDDGLGDYWALNQILRRHDPEREAHPRTLRFVPRDDERVGAAQVAATEAYGACRGAFVELWRSRPEMLLRLLRESELPLAHAFATSALRGCPGFLASLDLETIAMLLERPFASTARLGFELACLRLDRSREPRGLVLASARSVDAEARARAHMWIDADREALLDDPAFLAGLTTAPHLDTRNLARMLLTDGTLTLALRHAYAARVLATLLSLGRHDAECIGHAGLILLELGGELGLVALHVIRDLLRHPALEARVLGAELLLRKGREQRAIPSELLLGLLEADESELRALGARLLGALPEAALVREARLIARLSISRKPELRTAAASLLRTLGNDALRTEIAQLLVEALLRRKLPAGTAEHVAYLLGSVLDSALEPLPSALVFRALASREPLARALGARLLLVGGRTRLPDVSSAVALAQHELAPVREHAIGYLRENVDLVRAQVATVVEVLEGPWDDARSATMRILRESLPPEDITLEVIASLCEGARPDVRALGRELLARRFRMGGGAELLRTLSDHPSPSVQRFASLYLDTFASGELSLWQSLVPYFARVLVSPESGRAAKQRVLSFLRREGARDEPGARTVQELLVHLASRVTAQDRAAALEAMLTIHRAQPGVPLPLNVVPYELRV